jgi:hypothetical protein
VHYKNNIFNISYFPTARFLKNNQKIIIKTQKNGSSYAFIVLNSVDHYIYKIYVGTNPLSSDIKNKSNVLNIADTHIMSMSLCSYICLETSYVITSNWYNLAATKFNFVMGKLLQYKPIYFERFKYVGKGFKLILKKKKMFNCVFGYSHIYLFKLQTLIVKRTKKYKHVFIAPTQQCFLKAISLLRCIKPINRYTLRGVRTYTHIWYKRKGRKSVATHI